MEQNKTVKNTIGQRLALVVVPTMVAMGSAQAAAIDTTGVTAALTDAGTAAGVVGAAVLIVLIGIKAFKFIRSAL